VTTLAQYSAARAALAEAARVEQVMHVRDEVEHLKLYARQIKDRSLMAEALEMQLRCERRLGELLVAAKELGQIAEGRRPKNCSDEEQFPRVVLADAGIDRKLSSKAQKAASLSQQAFDAMVEQARNKLVSGASIIVDMVKAEDKKGRRDEKEAALAERIRAASANVGNGKLYGLILADPAWRFEPYSRETGMDRAPENHYPTMTLDKIEALQIPAADDCVLFLWATAPMLQEALSVMGAWGFTYKSQIIWVKDRIGTGYWARNKHELLLIGTKGSIPAPAPGTQPESAILAPVSRHSEKPEVFHGLIERLFPNVPKLEMFSRRARPGWDSWGAEADLPPHDEDGVIIEPASVPSDAEDGQGDDAERQKAPFGALALQSSSVAPSEEGAAIALNASSSQIKSNAKATEVEPGNAGGTVPVRHNNDRAGVASRLAGGRTPDSEEGGSCALGASPSSHPLSPSGELTATGTNGGDHEDEVATAILKSSDNRQVLDEPSGADPGSAVESGAQVSEVAAIAPASAAIAPVELSPSRDVAPGAPHSGEMPDLPAIFDSRSKAA